MAIDLTTVNWIYVALMAGFAFVAALLGSVISFRNRVGGALSQPSCSPPCTWRGITIRTPRSSCRSLPPMAIRRLAVDLSAGPVMRRMKGRTG